MIVRVVNPDTRFGVTTRGPVTVHDRRDHFLAARLRNGRTLQDEIIHCRRQAAIEEGVPPTLDLWIPPRGTSVAQHIANRRTRRNLERDNQEVESLENQRNFRFFWRLLTAYIIIITSAFLV